MIQNVKCGKKCNLNNGTCMDQILLSELIAELEWFWGSANEVNKETKKPNDDVAVNGTSQRKLRMGEALVSAVKYGTIDAV